jgi:predicted TIM-barrel fold metal-dependent hydrolase
MAGMPGLRIVDADTHLSEPPDLWTSRAPAKYRDQVPRVVADEHSRGHWVMGDDILLSRAGAASFVDPAGRKRPLFDQDITSGRSIEDVHAASYDARARLELMDELGVYAHVIYPNAAGFAAGNLLQLEDRGLSAAIVSTYNDAVAEWASVDPHRLLPQAMVPFWDIERAVAELERAVTELGLTGFTMAGEPNLAGLPDLTQPAWDPLYEACSDLDVPINIHVGATSFAGTDHGVWPSLSPRASKPVHSVQMELNNSRFMANLLVSDVLLRWPKTKWVSVESGIGWIPYVLERLDYEFFEEFDGFPAPDRPTARELFHRNVYGCFWFEITGPQELLEQVGVDNVLWESDFPHPTCLYPDPVARTLENLAPLPPEHVRKLLQDNAAKLYKIDLAAPAAV